MSVLNQVSIHHCGIHLFRKGHYKFNNKNNKNKKNYHK